MQLAQARGEGGEVRRGETAPGDRAVAAVFPRHAQVPRCAPLSERLDALAGRYRLTERIAGAPVVVTVTRDGGALTLAAPPFMAKFEMYPATADSFFTINGSNVVFTRDRAGVGVTVRLGRSRATRITGGVRK